MHCKCNLIQVHRITIFYNELLRNLIIWKKRLNQNRSYYDWTALTIRGCFVQAVNLSPLSRWSPKAENHGAAAERCGLNPRVLSLRGEGGGSALAGVSHRRAGAQGGHEGNRALQEGHQPRGSVTTRVWHPLIWLGFFYSTVRTS